MTWRRMLLLGGIGLIVAIFVAAFQSTPGYMDADSYYAGGRQLATGHGFNDLYLWNYLDDPAGLPHPSNSYWMPLASLLTAVGATLLGAGSWWAARAGFLLVAAAIPPITAALAWSFSSRRDLAFLSGLLAAFPVFYLPFETTTDTFGLYILLGGCFFLLVTRYSKTEKRNSIFATAFLLGVTAGLMHLGRTDGLLWLLMAWLAVILIRKTGQSTGVMLLSALFVMIGYSVIMGPWIARDISVFGTPMAPGGSKMLWLTSYDQIFAYPASQLTQAAWWHSGLAAILKARVWALGLNLATTLSVQGEIILLPLIGIGLWVHRRDRKVLLAILAWALTIGAMTIIFPFAGARGGFFHSGAALQTIWWGMAPIGLERVIDWGTRKRGWKAVEAGRIFRTTLLVLAICLSAVIFWTRIIGKGGYQAWSQESNAYNQIGKYIVTQGDSLPVVIMVANPPGFYLASGIPAIAVPDGEIDSVLTVAEKYDANYLVLEAGSVPESLQPIYDHPNEQTELQFIGEIDHARIFLIPRN